jgi:hypothetical protein
MAKKPTKKAAKKAVKKTKPKVKRVLSKTEISLKNKQQQLTRKIKKAKETFTDLANLYPTPKDREAFIKIGGQKKKVKTFLNEALNGTKSLAKEYNKITKKRVKLTKGKYKPKSNALSRYEATKEEVKDFSETKGIVRFAEFQSWELKDFQEDVLKFATKGYKVNGFDLEDNAEEILSLFNSIFLDMAVASEEGFYPILVLFKDTKKKNLLTQVTRE